MCEEGFFESLSITHSLYLCRSLSLLLSYSLSCSFLWCSINFIAFPIKFWNSLLHFCMQKKKISLGGNFCVFPFPINIYSHTKKREWGIIIYYYRKLIKPQLSLWQKPALAVMKTSSRIRFIYASYNKKNL